MRNLFTFILMLLFPLTIVAQEINSKVSINTPKLQQTDPKVMETLERAIQEFLNNTRWTNDLFESNELIDLTININIREELAANAFIGDFYIQATRPIYGSNNSTAIFQYNDKDFGFEYKEYDPLIFSDNVFNSNLTSFLAFYVYVCLGLDYDTFSLNGGSLHFQKAQEIQTMIPTNLASAFQKGWRSIDGQRNRYWLIESILSPRTSSMREAMYQYHRLGLDIMSEDVDAGRKAVYDAIMKVREVNESYPNSMIVQIFTLAKSDEIVNIFINGLPKEKTDVYGVMVRIDAANSSKYRAIRQ